LELGPLSFGSGNYDKLSFFMSLPWKQAGAITIKSFKKGSLRTNAVLNS